ncbi:sodium:dicarboxylate symporter [Pseudomonas sp. Leaf58]|uniref:cation:dicarboxylate symporter family transporter n=1 Tax=Pseudomonas sp. Leaf58 TaxID=1736226 RepID=UPI0006FAB2AB|nr:cation:dicarboxylase symporter family transporter [Pseudomonas sp. Leaf58]AYG45172.1 sodium:dicarboxylate symporter [Pseudomonas sp. Leaf58]KQN59284.1 sodium:dicarboxylate symporter [Pseudomonas sp. Leaf58]
MKIKINLITQIAIGLVVGVSVGLLLNHFPDYKAWWIDQVLQPAGDAFIKLMKMIIVPLVFSCMVVGIAGSGRRSLGRVGTKSLVYFFAVTGVAIVFGLLVGNVLQPGTGAHFSVPSAGEVAPLVQNSSSGLGKVLLGIIPDNVVAAMAEAKLLSVLFFAILFGVALSTLEEPKRRPLVAVLQAVVDTMFKITHMVMAYSPVGIFALIAVTVSTFGVDSLLPLAKLIGITYVAVLFFAIVVLGLVARVVGENIFEIIRAFKDELILAFSSASSATVMPQLMAKSEARGVPRAITSLVIPLGYSFNLDGASLFAGLGTLFIAQAYNIELALADQVMLVFIMVLTSKGAAGVPGFMFVILTATLTAAGLPLEGVALIAGVYRLMDMPVTALNVLGNALAPIVVAKWESRSSSLQPDSGVHTV